MGTFLSHADVTRLLKDPSTSVRTDAAAKVASEYTHQPLTDKEREIAEDILRLLIKDTEVRVREAMSAHLKESEILPKDIALALCRDVDSVALPVLEFSKALDDADLIEIIRSQGQAKQMAIARRGDVGEEVADALVETRDREVVITLAGNHRAAISDDSYNKMMDHFGADEGVNDALVHRTSLPVTVAERLVTLVSDQLREYLVTHHELPNDLATDLVLQSRERATIGLVSDDTAGLCVQQLVTQLRDHGRLTASIILRAICMGDMQFFEHALAALARVPLKNAQTLIHDAGPLGLEAIYKTANLPPLLLPVVRSAVNIASETEYDGREHDRERYAQRMIERVLTQLDDFDADNLEYLLAKLRQLDPTGLVPAH